MERTFTAFNPSQASSYLRGRGVDNDNLSNLITSHHASKGGQFRNLLDLGCGPGNSTRPLAKYFDEVIGCDPSKGMIDTARKMSNEAGEKRETKTGKKIEWEVATAEDCLEEMKREEREVDMISAGMAAHWFDLHRFWPLAASVLRQNGTVALWQYPSLLCFHPSTPNAHLANAIINRLISHDTAAFEAPGNRLCRLAYTTLPLPWTLSPAIPAFPKPASKRFEFDRGGELTDGKHFFLGDKRATMQDVYESMETCSMVQRWREANRGKAHGEEDVARRAIKEIRGLEGGENVIVGRDLVVLMCKRIRVLF